MRWRSGILLVMALVVSACGGDADPDPTTTTTIAAVAATTTTTAAAIPDPTTTAPAVTTTTAASVGAGGDDCLVGTWNPDQTELEDFLLTLYRPYAADATLDSGTIDLIFADDGGFEQQYNGVSGSGTAAGTSIVMEFTGGSFGTWESSGNQITIQFEGSDIGVIVNGAPAGAPPIPASSADASYTCDGDTLLLEPPADTPGAFWPLPRNWSRAI